MPAPIEVTPRVVVPSRAVSVRAVRSSGPGGQHVNKVATRVELHVDIDAIVGLDDEARARLDALTRTRRDADGRWLVSSQRTRDQARNLEDAREKVRVIVARALVAPARRRPTQPTSASRARRLDQKRRLGETKRRRSRSDDE